MKKITSIALAVIMVFSAFMVFPFTAAAEVLSTATVESKTVTVDETFDVYTTVTGDAGITMLGLKYTVDSEYLELVSATDLTEAALAPWDSAKMRISWAGETDIPAMIEAANGKIMKLTFKALKEGTTNVACLVSELNENIDAAEKYDATAGVITINTANSNPGAPVKLISGADIDVNFLGGYNGVYDETIDATVSTITSDKTPTTNEDNYFNLSLGNTPVGEGANKITHVKIGYEISENTTLTTRDNLNVFMSIAAVKSSRFWGFDIPYAHKADWVLDLTTLATKGGQGFAVGDYNKAVATDTYDGMRLNVFATHQLVPAGTTFAVKYIAFFTNAEDAANYEYPVPTEEVTPVKLISGSDISLSYHDDVFSSVYDASTGSKVVEFTSDTSIKNNEDNYFNLSLGNTPVGEGANKITHVKIGYELSDNVSLSNSDNLNVYMTLAAKGDGRFWGINIPYQHKADLVYDFTALNSFGGENGFAPGDYNNAVATDTYNSMRVGILAHNQTVPTGTKFAVKYIAFFTNADDAANYVYTPKAPTETVTVTFMADGVQFGEVVVLDKGAALVYPETEPTKDGFTFKGWDVAAGTPVNENIVVNAIFEEIDDTAYVMYGNEIGIVKGLAWTFSTTDIVDNTAIINIRDEEGANWDNDGCLTLTFNGFEFPATHKYYVLGIGNNITSATAATTHDNIAFTIGGTPVLTDVDLAGDAVGEGPVYRIVDLSELITDTTAKVTAIQIDPVWRNNLGAHADDKSGGTRVGKGATFNFTAIAAFATLDDAEAFIAEQTPAETVTVTFKADGVQFGEVVVLDKGAALVYPETEPTKDGYTFKGWDVAAGTVVNENIVVNAIFEEINNEVKPVALYHGNEITFTGSGALESFTTEFDMTTGIQTATLPAFTGHDHNRIAVNTPGAPKTAHYMALGVMISDYSDTSDNVCRIAEESGTPIRMWGGADSNKTFNKTEIGKIVIDFSLFADWNKVTDTDKVIGMYINAWKAAAMQVPAGATVSVQYAAFFETREAAEAFVYEVPDFTKATVSFVVNGVTYLEKTVAKGDALVYPTAAELKEAGLPNTYSITGWNVAEGTVINENMTVNATYEIVAPPLTDDAEAAADVLNLTGDAYWTYTPAHSVAKEGSTWVATGDSDWQNDGCAQLYINNFALGGSRFIVLNMSVEGNAQVNDGSSGKNVVVTDGTKTEYYGVDFTAVKGETGEVLIDLGDKFAGVDTLTKVTLDVFKNNKVDGSSVGNLQGVKVVFNSIATPDFGIEIVDGADGDAVLQVIPADGDRDFVLPEKATSNVENQRFIGWEVNGTSYAPGSPVSVTGNLVVKAIFETATDWVVTYVVNGEETEIRVDLGAALVHIPAPTAPNGYKFAGWVDENGNIVYSGTTVTNDMTLTAVFVRVGGEDNSEFINTFIAVLKKIKAKKDAGGSVKPETKPTQGAVVTLGKDLQVDGNVYWKQAGNTIGIVGDALVATGSNDWQHNDTTDACADLIISNLNTNGETKLTINMNVVSDDAALADGTGDKKVYADGTKKGSVIVTYGTTTERYDIDFTPALDNTADIVVDLGNAFKTAKTLDSVTLSIFKTNTGNLFDVAVTINSITAGTAGAEAPAETETPAEPETPAAQEKPATPAVGADTVVLDKDAFTVKGAAELGECEGVYDAATGTTKMVTTADAVGADGARFVVNFDPVPVGNDFLAIGIMVKGGTHRGGDNLNVNMNIGGVQTRMWGASTKYSATKIEKAVVDLSTCNGGDKGLVWADVKEGDFYEGLTINPWQLGEAIPAGTTVEIQYIAFCNTAEAANAFTYAG